MLDWKLLDRTSNTSRVLQPSPFFGPNSGVGFLEAFCLLVYASLEKTGHRIISQDFITSVSPAGLALIAVSHLLRDRFDLLFLSIKLNRRGDPS